MSVTDILPCIAYYTKLMGIFQILETTKRIMTVTLFICFSQPPL